MKVNASHDYSAVAVAADHYTLDSKPLTYQDVLYFVLDVDAPAPFFEVAREWGVDRPFSYAVGDGRELRILLAAGPAAVCGRQLKDAIGPRQAGPWISRIIAGFTVEPQPTGRRFGELSHDALRALEQLTRQIETLCLGGDLMAA
jgi:hypothetical protein